MSDKAHGSAPQSGEAGKKKGEGISIWLYVAGGILLIFLLYGLFKPDHKTNENFSESDSSSNGNVNNETTTQATNNERYHFNSKEYTIMYIPNGKEASFRGATVDYRVHIMNQSENDDKYGKKYEDISSKLTDKVSSDNCTLFIKATNEGEEGEITLHIEPKQKGGGI